MNEIEHYEMGLLYLHKKEDKKVTLFEMLQNVIWNDYCSHKYLLFNNKFLKHNCSFLVNHRTVGCDPTHYPVSESDTCPDMSHNIEKQSCFMN